MSEDRSLRADYLDDVLDTHGAPPGDTLEDRLRAWAEREQGWIGQAERCLSKAQRCLSKAERLLDKLESASR